MAAAMVVLAVLGIITVFNEPLGALFLSPPAATDSPPTPVATARSH